MQTCAFPVAYPPAWWVRRRRCIAHDPRARRSRTAFACIMRRKGQTLPIGLENVGGCDSATMR